MTTMTCNFAGLLSKRAVLKTSTRNSALVTSEPILVLPGRCFLKISHFHVPDCANSILLIFMPHCPSSGSPIRSIPSSL